MIADNLRTFIPGNPFLDFLSKRIELDSYRGNQVSQHNRYDFEQVYEMLSILNNLVGPNMMKIRTTDLSKRSCNTDDEREYAEYTRLVKKRFGKGTQDSIRKNLFVDFHRMGLIDRYDKNAIKLDQFEKKPVSFISLNYLSINLLDSKNTVVTKYYLYNRALDNILKGLVSDLYDIMTELESNYIDLNEYTFVVSFLYQDYYGKTLYKQDIIDLVKEYRLLSRFQKQAINEKVREICNPTLFKGTKVEKRDYHNWINESQQVFSLLNQTTYYEYSSSEQKLFLMIADDIYKAESSKLKRSKLQKDHYFTNHNVSKKNGFELHHIIPLSWARSRQEFYLLDQWQNMVYIDGYSHAKITQSGNNHVILNFNESDVILINHNLDEIYCYFNKNVIYHPQNAQIMRETNEMLQKI
jgi:hypothetical protein